MFGIFGVLMKFEKSLTLNDRYKYYIVLSKT